MPRIRTIKPEFFLHEGLAELSFEARLAFIALWTLADCAGRFEYRPKRLKLQTLPYDDVDIEDIIASLERGGWLRRYESNGTQFFVITGFMKHQQIGGKEMAGGPRTPEPDWNMPGTCPERDKNMPGMGTELQEQGTRNKEQGTRAEQSGDPLPPDRVVMSFPTKKNDWPLTEHKLKEYEDTFSTINVMDHLKRARQWLIDNPDRRKTERGMPKFLSGWLGRQKPEAGDGGAEGSWQEVQL